MRAGGHVRRRIVLGWTGVALCGAAATVLGYEFSEFAGSELRGSIDGFAAGALLVMLVVSMIPEAREKAQNAAV